MSQRLFKDRAKANQAEFRKIQMGRKGVESNRHSHGAEGTTRVAQGRDLNLPHELIHLRDRVSP